MHDSYNMSVPIRIYIHVSTACEQACPEHAGYVPAVSTTMVKSAHLVQQTV